MAAPFYPHQGHSHITCQGCHVLLMYPQGATNVRCSRCSVITSAPPAATETAQITCNGCRVLLSYPRGAQSVQCSLCNTITQVPVYGNIVCGNCQTMLMYPLGAPSVKCSLCHHVTAAFQASSMQPMAAQAPRPAHKPTQTVVIENPPTVDDSGNEVANIAVGVKSDDGR